MITTGPSIFSLSKRLVKILYANHKKKNESKPNPTPLEPFFNLREKKGGFFKTLLCGTAAVTAGFATGAVAAATGFGVINFVRSNPKIGSLALVVGVLAPFTAPIILIGMSVVGGMKAGSDVTKYVYRSLKGEEIKQDSKNLLDNFLNENILDSKNIDKTLKMNVEALRKEIEGKIDKSSTNSEINWKDMKVELLETFDALTRGIDKNRSIEDLISSKKGSSVMPSRVDFANLKYVGPTNTGISIVPTPGSNVDALKMQFYSIERSSPTPSPTPRTP